MTSHQSRYEDLPVIFLMGPTASGKTDIAAELSTRLPIELVSVDAAQVYRGMNIGTAKPDDSFLEQYPHHLIDIRSPRESYSAAEFCEDAIHLCRDIKSRGRIPLLVGGTLFYFSALENGLSDLPAADPETRLELESIISNEGIESLYQELEKVDPVTANRISKNDPQRIQRAVEIYRITGKPPSVVMRDSVVKKPDFRILKLSLFHENRKFLHDRIETRFRRMLEEGLVNEVDQLRTALGDIDSLSSMRTVGYRQVLTYLNGETNHQEMLEKGVAATRQLAKRQLTWLRQQSNVVWCLASHRHCARSVSEYIEHSLAC